jgi:alpha-D-ribose 1-methylphosphonate 5-triphosphate synthase subunit PhnI
VDDPEKVSLYNYGIFNKDDELVAYVAIDRNMEKGIVTQRSLAAVFTSNDWEDILEKSYIRSLKKEIANFGYIKALRNKTWLN